MLDHVSITVSDIPAAERFYDAIMKALDVVKVGRRDDWLGYGERARAAYPDRVYLTIRKGPKPEEAFGPHWCFKAKWRTQVDAFWDAGIAAGGTDDGAPGLRDYHASYYGAFLRDSRWQPHRGRVPSRGVSGDPESARRANQRICCQACSKKRFLLHRQANQ
ncbi:VOC family protein [Bradyrhizobium sp. AZCC 2289]|uniref:VOC family protein n=1 Tax=Bradyrhizobium sp. AZCC 2289 TaxID=3117026 RepID=UPI002FF1EAAA